jgi:hypothetical protein
MRLILIAAMIGLMIIPAHARGQKRSSDSQQQNSEQQKKTRQQEDKDYKAALGRIPDQKPADPWAKVR